MEKTEEDVDDVVTKSKAYWFIIVLLVSKQQYNIYKILSPNKLQIPVWD